MYKLIVQIENLDNSEEGDTEVEEYPFVQDEGDSFRISADSKLDLKLKKYDVFGVYTKKNYGLSFQISGEQDVLIRFGGYLKSTVGFGVTRPELGKHFEIIFEAGSLVEG